MSDVCELCGGDGLKLVYRPERSTRDIAIHLCSRCSLVQSLPRRDRAERAPAAVSSGADWGNVRYGKGFRTSIAIGAVARHADLNAPLAILDVGSNRGSFAKAMLETAPQATLVAVEPDERVARSCAGLDRTELVTARIEDIPLETGRFDIVHSCHTIEHLAHPARVLADHWRSLKDGGLLVLDAPNIAILGVGDIVEEWFIDKHLYHFSARTLGDLIEAAGFEIIEGPSESDRSNLFFVARKSHRPPPKLVRAPKEAERIESLISRYNSTRAQNIAALASVAAELTRLAPRGLAIWGAGRLFDSLIVHGQFDPARLTLLIDTHLKSLVGERHGCAVSGPEALAPSKVATVVVMSRDFAAEIAEQIRKSAPQTEIILYAELIARARMRRAA